MFLRLATLVAVLPIPLSGVAQETDELTDVVVTGYGTSIEEAKRNAFRAAVEAVVSMYVDATTHVRNGELIENEVLSYSAGLIEKSVLIGEPEKTETGIFFVKIMATVKKHQVRERLRALPVVNVQLDGESLFARMASAQDNLADAEAIIQSGMRPVSSRKPFPGKTAIPRWTSIPRPGRFPPTSASASTWPGMPNSSPMFSASSVRWPKEKNA